MQAEITKHITALLRKYNHALDPKSLGRLTVRDFSNTKHAKRNTMASINVMTYEKARSTIKKRHLYRTTRASLASHANHNAPWAPRDGVYGDPEARALRKEQLCCAVFDEVNLIPNPTPNPILTPAVIQILTLLLGPHDSGREPRARSRFRGKMLF